MKKQLLSFLFASLLSFLGYGQITIDESLTTQELVEDVLINSSCAEVSNIVSSTGTDFGDVNGIAAFSANGSDFPFEEGIILMSGSVQQAPGPNTSTQSNGGWPGDADLEANTTAINTNNASFIEFDFTPFIEQISFNFIMASEEYDQNFECTFSDAFAFILTDITTGTVQNLAVLPGTTIPIEVTNIRPEVPGQCAAVNEEFFDRYNFQPFNDENTAATNFNGQTVQLTAMADVISGNPYSIKLVVADQSDSAFDIGVFLEAGSFNIGTTDLGDDILVSNGNAVCEGDTVTLNAEDPDAVSYTWFMDNVEIVGETNPTLDVTTPGTYSVSVSLNNTDCTIEDEIVIEFITASDVDLGDDIDACEGDAVVLDVDIPESSATFSWFFNNAILIDETNSTLNVTQAGEYAVVVNFNSGCSFSDVITVDFTTAPIIELGDTINSCLENPITLDATPSNVDPSTVTFQWFLNSVVLIGETSATLNVTQAGTYNVTVTSGPCIITDSVTVAPLTILFELGDDFNTCFDETVTLDATPTNIDPNGATYEWSLNSTVIVGEESPMLIITEAGTYEVTVSSGICSNTDTITVTQANPDGSPCVEPEPTDCTILDAGPDLEVDCDNLCVDLNASIITLPLTSTSSYRVEQIECPNPPVEGDPTNLQTDDLWSDAIDLPFTFSYFQNDYTSLVVGANGQISFNTALAGQPNGWNSEPGELLPFNDEAAEGAGAEFPFNTIYGAYHDIDPSVNSAPDRINFFISGDAPYRTFVLNFNMVPQFSCNDLLTSQQIILYESLNVIDVNIINKPVCAAWNDGLATLGIMGNDLTEFAVPDGRNTGDWEAFDESWRFVPDGPVSDDAEFTWTDEDGNVISNETTFNVCPTETTTYTATLTFTNPDGSISTISDDVVVTSDTSSCDGPSDCTVLDAGPDLEVDCEDPCVDLSASIITLPLTSTASYRIEQIECPNPPTDGDPTNLTIDDSWSDVIDLPFTFTYYQNDYTGLVIGANGQISFDLALANGFNDWNIDPGQTIPNNDQATFPFNTIYGAFHDIDPSVNGDPDAINFFVSGDAPYRTFVLNFDMVPQFSCNDLLTSQQIVLYESLNVIEVNIINKPVCAAWNDGLATLGIMGNDATEFAVPDGRNTGDWEAFDESWRFVPDGLVSDDTVFTWTDEDGTVLSNDLIFNVCPTETTTYTATLTFTNPDGSTSSISDDVTVTANVIDYTVDLGDNLVFCDVASYEIIPELTGNVTNPTFLWSTTETTETITVTTSGTYTVEVTVDGCVMMDEVTITFLDSPCTIDSDCLVIDFLEDFGTGTERVSTPFTQYVFNPGPGEVNDGEYAIINTSAELNNGWHDNLEDNTPGDVDGRALFVNADFNTDEFYRRTVDNLLADTNYTFNAFITTVYDTDTNICPNNGIPANVTFRVEDPSGATLAEIDTGDIPNEADPNWQQFTIDFNSAMNTSVQIVLVNNSIGGCGNDLAIDDISLSFSGGNPMIATPMDLELCDDLGDMVEIFDLTSQIPAILNGENPADFNISFHTTQLDAEANASPVGTPAAYANTTNPETIYVRVERVLDTSCFSIVEFDLILNEVFSLANNLPATIEICSTDAIPALDATPIDPNINQSMVTYLWTDAANTTVSTDAQFTPSVAGVYTVVVELLPCSQETFTVDLTIVQAPIVDLGSDELICNDESFEIIPNISGDVTGATLLWSTGETTDTIIVDQSGTYDLTVTVGPCSVTDSITIDIEAATEISLGDDFTTCREFPNTLIAVRSDLIGESNPELTTFAWFLNGDIITGETSSTLEFVIPETAVGTQEFTVVTTTAAGCTTSDTVEVSLFDVGNCVISQGISPDDTPGFNDTLDLEFLAARTGIDVIQIYNRLGTLVYEQNDYVNQWRGQTDNGNDLPTGTYFYVINLEEEDPVYGRQATGWVYVNRGE